MSTVKHDTIFLTDELGHEISWCKDSQNERDVKYLLATPVREAAPDLLEALKALASNPKSGEYESEYDGRVYTFCHGCNFQDDVRPNHGESCDFAKARAAIAKATGAA